MNETQRKAVYAFVAALIPVAVTFGVLTNEQAGVIATAVLAFFSLIMAYRNVPAPGDKQQSDAPVTSDSDRPGV